MDSLITVMNKLQDVFSTIGGSQKVDLPQIVVVGSQSSGKSSVLESLVGKSFLPRGTGIVTRAPLILHLINPTDNEIELAYGLNEPVKDWGTFLHKPNVIFTDFNEIRKEIEHRTEELAGGKKNITDKPIVLNVYSKFLYNLSFVDLPGLTKVPVGDQPKDIEEKIRFLVFQFIKNPNSIILAVVTANTDPATSESLHVAKSVDPNGDRTIAVVTKIDIMDAGTNASELLSGEVIPVKLGIIGVINRSQKDITENKSMEDSLIAEKNFFQKTYPGIAKEHGTINLGKKLEKLLIKKIRETCPALKKQLYGMNANYGVQVKKVKEFTDNYDRSLLDLITQLANSYRALLDGQSNNISLTELQGGAKIASYFKTVFNKEIDEIDPLYNLSNTEIINVIKNASGTNTGVFMPDQAFDHLVKKQLKLMEFPALSCVNYVHEELVSNIFNLDDEILSELKKYPKLMEKVTEVLQTMLDKYKHKTIDAVSKSIRYQEAYINTNHPDFVQAIIESKEYNELFEQTTKIEEKGISGVPANSHVLNGSISQNINGQIIDNRCSAQRPIDQAFKVRHKIEKVTTCTSDGFNDTDDLILTSRAILLTLFIKCYFKVIKKIIQDIIPKTIMCEMVNNVKNNFQKDLTSKIYKSNNLEMKELFLESDEIVDERTKVLNRFAASEKALKLMREIEQLCSMTD